MDIGRCNDWNSKMADISGVGSCNEISRNCPVISPLLPFPLSLSIFPDIWTMDPTKYTCLALVHYPSLLKVCWITNISKKYLDPSIVDSSRCRKWKKMGKKRCARTPPSPINFYFEREIRSFRTKGS